MIAFDASVAVILFGLTLLAWVAAVQAPAVVTHALPAWAVIVSATLSAAIIVPSYWLKIHDIWWNLMGKTKHSSVSLLGNIVHRRLALFVTVWKCWRRALPTRNPCVTASRRNRARSLESAWRRCRRRSPQFLFTRWSTSVAKPQGSPTGRR
jgi:hypothetical protein